MKIVKHYAREEKKIRKKETNAIVRTPIIKIEEGKKLNVWLLLPPTWYIIHPFTPDM